VKTLTGSNAGLRKAVFSPDGAFVFGLGANKKSLMWNLATGARIIEVTHSNYVNAAVFIENGRFLAVTSYQVVEIIDARNGRIVANLAGHTDWVNDISMSQDGSKLVTSGADKTVIVWDVASRAPLQTLRGHTAYVNAAAFTLDGSALLSGSYDGTLRLWDIGKAKEIAKIGY
jgi:WD40 repeat protein